MSDETNNERGDVLASSETISVCGRVLIDFTVQCPHCDENFYLSLDREWFEVTMGGSFPTDGVDGQYDAFCLECAKHFIIDGFSK